MENGTVRSVNFNGRWRRNGTTIMFRHVAEASNGWMNLDIVEWDMTGKTVTLSGYVLE
jgi:aryl carrier-like protein